MNEWDQWRTVAERYAYGQVDVELPESAYRVFRVAPSYYRQNVAPTVQGAWAAYISASGEFMPEGVLLWLYTLLSTYSRGEAASYIMDTVRGHGDAELCAWCLACMDGPAMREAGYSLPVRFPSNGVQRILPVWAEQIRIWSSPPLRLGRSQVNLSHCCRDTLQAFTAAAMGINSRVSRLVQAMVYSESAAELGLHWFEPEDIALLRLLNSSHEVLHYSWTGWWHSSLGFMPSMVYWMWKQYNEGHSEEVERALLEVFELTLPEGAPVRLSMLADRGLVYFLHELGRYCPDVVHEFVRRLPPDSPLAKVHREVRHYWNDLLNRRFRRFRSRYMTMAHPLVANARFVCLPWERL